MKIPSKLKIGGFNINIRLIADLEDDGALNNNVILINNQLDQKDKELTLWHEIIHCLNPAFTEKDVEWLSRALYQVFVDNNLLR